MRKIEIDKGLFTFIIICSCFIILGVYFFSNLYDATSLRKSINNELVKNLENIKNEYEKNEMPSNCKDFNGRMFLLSGGSLKPSNQEELIYTINRDAWLCDGGKLP